MRTRLYGQLARTRAVALDDEIETLGQLYQDLAVSGTCTDATRAASSTRAGAWWMPSAPQAIVLAGTDLNLAFDGHDRLSGDRCARRACCTSGGFWRLEAARWPK